jgi:pimeloyl-ACP methyl ester carboxylesterase
MEMHFVRRGGGKPLLLLHGLGGSWRSWSPVLDALATERDVLVVDLPGFGDTPPLQGDVSIATLADAVAQFLGSQRLLGIDVAGSSMGARLALELSRRGLVGATVALDPGGFWNGWEKRVFLNSLRVSIGLVRALQPAMPFLTANALGRSVLLAQFSAKPAALPASLVLDEMRSFARAQSFDELLNSLVFGPEQQGLTATAQAGPIVIGWGRQDRVCFPDQARRALRLFPGARVHWFDRCGHFPQWDAPAETVRVILSATAGAPAASGDERLTAARAG